MPALGDCLITVPAGSSLNGCSLRESHLRDRTGALVLALPVMAVLALASLPGSWGGIDLPAWAGLAYVSVFSMLVGFIFWYRGLALGGIAGVGQLQLLQPFLGLALAGLLLREPVAWSMIAATAIAVLCVAGAKRFA